MKRFWNYISSIGIEEEQFTLKDRTTVLNNQLNFILAFLTLFLFVTFSIMLKIDNIPMDFLFVRVLWITIFAIFNLFLAKIGYIRLSKTLFVFIPILLILVPPTLLGFYEEISYLYFSLIIIGFSVLPQIVFIDKEDRWLLISSMLFYFILLLLGEPMLNYFAGDKLKISNIIGNDLVYLKATQISIFAFLNFSIFYMRRLNIHFECKLNERNLQLDSQNIELKNALNKLKLAQQHLVQSEKLSALGTLISGISHEINNPLNFISGGVDILRDTHKRITLSEEESLDFEESTQMINEGIVRISSVVDSLNAFSMKVDDKREERNIGEILDRTITFLRWDFSPDILIERDYRFLGPVTVYPAKLHHVLLSITENAFEALQQWETDCEKIIRVGTKIIHNDSESLLSIEIFNTGPGINSEILSSIFDPFFTTKDPNKGIGLGLSTAYKYIKEQKGSIEAINTVKGVLFKITIPIN